MSEDAISFSGVDEIGHEVKKNDQGPRGQAKCQGCTQAQPSAETGAIGCETTTVQQNPWSLAIRYHKPNKRGGGGHHSRDRSYLQDVWGESKEKKEKIQNCDPSLEEMLF